MFHGIFVYVCACVCALTCTKTLKTERGRERNVLCSHCPQCKAQTHPFRSWSRTLPHGMVPPIFRIHLPTSIKSLWKCPTAMLYSICRGGHSYEAVVCVWKEHGPTAGMADYAAANMVHSTRNTGDAHIFSHHRLLKDSRFCFIF